MLTNCPPIVMTLAGADPSTGAGIQADMLSIISMGCHPVTVITSLTIQDSVSVGAIHPVDAEIVHDQARMILEDMPIAAFKIGLLGSIENVAVVSEILVDYPNIPVIFDPILAAGNGDDLSTDDLIAAIREMLIPLSTVITPNSIEARRIIDRPDLPLDSVAEDLRKMGCEYILITGTHENTPHVINTLYGRGGKIRQDSWTRLPGSYHGSGCTLASAIAACLANGMDVPASVREAQEYTWQTLQHGYRAGMGQFIPDRFFWARQNDDQDD